MYSLRLRLFLILLLVAVLAVAVVAFFASRGTIIYFNDYVSENVSRDSQLIQELLASPIEKGQFEEAQLIADTFGAAYGRSIIVRSDEGKVLLSSQPTHNETLPDIALHELELPPADGYVIETHPFADDTAYIIGPEQPIGSINEPVFFDETMIPTNELPAEILAINASATNETRFLGSVTQLFWIAAVTAVLLAGILSLGLSHRILKPIEALTTAARQMEKGDLSQQVNVKSKDEIGTLAHAFNSMSSSLATQEQLRRNMVSDVAHELRTPLANIRGYLEAIQDGLLTPNEALINSLHQESLLLNHLIDDLQELSLAEARQLRLNTQPIQINDLLTHAVTSLQPKATENDIALTSHIADNLPLVTADRERLGQVLRNLICNGIEHTPPTGTITVTAVSNQTNLTIQIQDNGEGISAEHLPYIFDRFYRVDESRSRRTGGTGLGLAISKALIEMHNGTIDVQSTIGTGTTFTLSLPINNQ